MEAVATPRNRGVNYRRFHSQPPSMSVVVMLRQQSAMGPREDPSARVTFSSLGLKGHCSRAVYLPTRQLPSPSA